MRQVFEAGALHHPLDDAVGAVEQGIRDVDHHIRHRAAAWEVAAVINRDGSGVRAQAVFDDLQPTHCEVLKRKV